MSSNIIASPLKVITADDSPLIAERLDHILREIENLSFLGNAFSISSAQNLIKNTRPDVVILDIQFTQDAHDLTGLDFLSEIRQNYPEIKIIIFTNHNELHYRIACLEKGADHFLDKSNDSHKISEILKSWTIRK